MALLYPYVGPPEIRERVLQEPARSIRVDGLLALADFARTQEASADGIVVLTFVVRPDRSFHVAPRRSEHVACAAGGDVLAAGELLVRVREPPAVIGATNQSTGFCPEPDCWLVAHAALASVGIAAPASLTEAYVFRRCESCGERNLVKEAWFVCSLCDADLPEVWNFD